MKERHSKYSWIPLWVDKWLFGSTRIELLPDERSVWVDLMALASKDNGYIRANENTPYPHEQLAGLLCISVELLNRTLNKCCNDPINKLTITKENTLFINSWEDYKLSERHQRRFSMSDNEDTVSTKVANHLKVEDTIIKEKNNKTILKEKKNIDFISLLKENPAYKEIDIDRELAKMDAWLLTPKGRGRKKTHKFILNWLNKIDIPLKPEDMKLKINIPKCSYDSNKLCYEDCPKCEKAAKGQTKEYKPPLKEVSAI